MTGGLHRRALERLDYRRRNVGSEPLSDEPVMKESGDPLPSGQSQQRGPPCVIERFDRLSLGRRGAVPKAGEQGLAYSVSRH